MPKQAQNDELTTERPTKPQKQVRENEKQEWQQQKKKRKA